MTDYVKYATIVLATIMATYLLVREWHHITEIKGVVAAIGKDTAENIGAKIYPSANK
jgi:hypothetical protein